MITDFPFVYLTSYITAMKTNISACSDKKERENNIGESYGQNYFIKAMSSL